jgi:hypothetical protein
MTCLLTNDLAPILAHYGIELDPLERSGVEYLASLPKIVLTLPEEEDGVVEEEVVRVEKGLLRPPRKVARLGKAAREKMKEERRTRALGEGELGGVEQ